MNSNLKNIKKIYEKTFIALNKTNKIPDIEVVFYPYVHINHTIRRRRGKIFVRISKMLESAPLNIHESLATILIAKLLRKKVPSQARKVYNEFINDEDFQKRAFENKKAKGKKIITSPEGKFFNLEEIFIKINAIYFQDSIPKPTLSWSARKTYHRLGHFDSAHNTIIVSKTFDEKNVPEFVVEFIVYHEMLHIKHQPQIRNGRRYSHTPAFKRDEKKFEYFNEAEEWIDKNIGKLKQKMKRRHF